MVYLTACKKKLKVTDWMGEVYEAENVQDLHDIIRDLLNKSRRKLSVMNNTIETTYTSNTLSINTLFIVLDYFKCKLNIIDN